MSMSLSSILITAVILICTFLIQISNSISSHPILIVISFDGFRFDYMNKTFTPTLDEIQRNGVYAEYMNPVFPTFTFANHQSIATGLYSSAHGIVDNRVFDTEYNTTLSGYTDDKGFWNYNGDVKPIWILNEEAGQGRVSGVFMWPGSGQGYGPDHNLVPRFYRHYNESVPWETRVQTIISWINHPHYPTNLIFLYFNEPDSKGHAIGPDDPDLLAEIQACDNKTKYLLDSLKAASIFDQVSFIILSDHGMESLPESQIIGMAGIASLDDFRLHTNPIITQIGPYPGKFEHVYGAFVNASKLRNFTVYLKHELADLNYVNDRRVMDIVLLPDLGYALDFSLSFDGGMPEPSPDENVYGIHGYDNKFPSMRPFFLAYGPLFKGGGLKVEPFNNIDLFSLFSKIAGISEAPNNGSFRNVERLLATPNVESSTSAYLHNNKVIIQISFVLYFLLNV